MKFGPPVIIQLEARTSEELRSFSIKHDLARSCFQLWPKIGDEGDKISRKKTGQALGETGGQLDPFVGSVPEMQKRSGLRTPQTISWPDDPV